MELDALVVDVFTVLELGFLINGIMIANTTPTTATMPMTDMPIIQPNGRLATALGGGVAMLTRV